MKLVKDNSLAEMWKTFHQYNFDRYQTTYHRYFGCGHHLYILVNECEKDRVVEIGSQRIHPREMAKRLSVHVADFRIACVDVEMGGIGVWDNKGEVRIAEGDLNDF